MLLEFLESPIHGVGAFALGDIKAGTIVLEYLGRKISKQESLRQCELRNSYIFYLDEEHDLDGSVEWNPARWLNHSCTPNSEAQLSDGSILIVAMRDIRRGEEVTFNYGYSLEEFREHPCHCGSASCVGFIVSEEFHDQLRRSTSASTASTGRVT